jgi:tRNA threonylcarbamoyladenosine biosynthesis protein TsaB
MPNYILSADTSGKTASVALLDHQKIIANYTINTGLTHSQKFLPLIEQMLVCVDIDISEIDYFAISNGPGSFTGLRIGVATIKAIAQALNKPIVEISTLDGLSYNFPNFSGYICPIIDARRQEVYTAVYKNGKKVMDDCNITLEDLFDFFKDKKGKIMFLGDGVLSYRDIIEKALQKRALFAPSNLLLQNASSVGLIAQREIKNGNITSYKNVKVAYLKKTQPEQEKEKNLK